MARTRCGLSCNVQALNLEGVGAHSHVKGTGLLVIPCRGQKHGFGTSWGVLKRSTVAAFVVPIRVYLNRKNMTGDNVLF